MHILFIYPSINTHISYQLGVCYLSSVLKASGHRVSLIVLRTHILKSNLVAQIRNLGPDLIGFSVVTNQWEYAREYIKSIKKKVDIPIIVGGIHTTVLPEETINTYGVDMICIGEGEDAFLDLVTRMEKGHDLTEVCNIWVKSGGKIVRNSLRDLIQDLDRIPFPDVELFLNVDEVKIAPLWTSRGCPFSCTYCCNHVLRRIYRGKGKYVRNRSLDNIFEEIHNCLQRFPKLEIFYIEDDILTLDKRRVLEFCRRYVEEQFRLPFCCNGHARMLDGDSMKALKKAGCKYISIGVESGSEWLRKNVLKREYSNDQAKEIFNKAKEIGLGTYAYYMCGFPFETEQMMDETVELHKTIKPDYPPQVGAFYPFPGTDLSKVCEEQNLLSGRTYDTFRTYRTTLRLPKKLRRHIERTFYALGGTERERCEELNWLRPRKMVFSIFRAVHYLFGDKAFYYTYFSMLRIGRFLKRILSTI